MTVLVVAVLLLSLLAWVGQLLSLVTPRRAAGWGLTELEAEVDPTFFADVRAEALWDSLTLWTLPLASILFLADLAIWPVFGLLGGAMFIYFAGRGIAQRVTMQSRGIRVGEPKTLQTYYVFLSLWGLAGAAFVVLAALTKVGRV